MVMNHFEFWAGLALLGFLQITAVFINMLPIPGLDGFGIAQPFLAPEISEKINLIRPFGFFILYGLLFFDTPLRDLFWEQVWNIAIWISPDLASLAYEGLEMFHFWG
jgi:Zn-dependent protease